MERPGAIYSEKKLTTLYTHTEDVHNLTAPREVVPVILKDINARSVLDVGCGIGTWLRAFEENGVSDYLGIDGAYVNKALLKIPVEKFKAQDLLLPWSLGRKFDLVLSLEVAEHLPEESANQFVANLVQHGDVIVFSAAIPGQGGQNHLNEQWPDYWQKKFEQQGFYFHDSIRHAIWNNDKIEWWYRQNIFLVTKTPSSKPIMDLVHPGCFRHNLGILQRANAAIVNGKLGVWESFKIFARSLFISNK